MNSPARRVALTSFVVLALALSLAGPGAADNTYQTLPFSQNWSNAGLITVNDSWTGVPGIVGFRGDNLVGGTGADAQTVTAADEPGVIDVIANQANPGGLSDGGVGEFAIADPVVALQGSGTADAPYLLLHLNTTGFTSIVLSFNARDIDGSADNSIQQVAVLYRVGATGTYTNVPAAYIADATTGPSLATLVTPMSVTLPAACNNQAQVQIRIITTNAVGNDEWVGIDDIAVTGTAADLPPSVVSTVPTAGATDVAIGSNITVTFNEAVTATTSSFTLECPAGPTNAQPFTVSGSGSSTIVLDPIADLPNSTACVATVIATQVTDLDGTADPMASNYPWTFTTASATPTLTINDVTLAEGNSGSTTFAFTVSLSAPAPSAVTFDIATADGTATIADDDYASYDLTGMTIAVGSSTYTFHVNVHGDTTFEPDETFFVNVTNVVGANVGDGQGQGTITNDDAPIYEIYAIQGSGAASPYATQAVRTLDNIVTAVGTEGFFIQTPDARADADPDTSNGIYVYTGSAPTVAVGDQVDVQGTVVEYYNFTEFQAGATVTIDSTGNPLPTAIELDATKPPTNPADPWWTIGFERLEGMLVHVAAGVVSDGNQRFASDTTAEVRGVMNPARAFRATGIKYPGVAGLPIWDGNPEIIEIDADRLGAVADPDYIAGGTTFSATGVIGFEFSNWELWPTVFTPVAPPMPRAVRVKNAGELTIGTYNLLQFNQGASNYALRVQKHSAYIRTALRSPDVLAVQECFSITELTALADRIEQDDPSVVYTPYLLEGNFGDIDVGFLVRDTVNHVAHYQVGKDYIAPGDTYPLHDRPPFVLEAEYLGNGAPFAFTVMVNHTRSLIDVETDPDVREKRLNQAQWLADWMQTYQTANPTRPFVMVGDLNAFEFTDGYVDVIGQMVGNVVPANNMLSGPDLVNPNLTIQALNVPANDRYSYLNEGTAQVLDHALTTQYTDTWVRGFQYGRGNADAAILYSYDAATPLRSSDHDGAVLFVMTDANADGIPDDSQTADLSLAKVDGPDPVLSGAALTWTLTVANAGPAASGPTTVTDTLPAGVSFVSASGTGWSCVESTGIVECDAANLAVGAAPDITITVTVTATSGTLSNTATVAGTITDPNSANNSATATTDVTPVADLSVAASAAPAAVAPGAPFVHTATVTNLGPSDSTGSTLTLSLPAGAVASTVTPGACVPAGATVTCTVGPLALDATFTATVEMTAGTTGTYVTTATVVGADADTVPANDTATASTAIGQVVATPSPVNMRVPIFTAGGAMTLNLLNDSPIPVGFTLLERPIEYTWLRFPINGPTWNVPAADSYARTARAVPQHPRPSLPAVELAPIATLDFPTGLVYPWGIGFNTLANDMWVHDIADAGGDGFNHRFLTDGTDTGDTIDTSSWIGDWAADLAYDPWNDKLWQINVGNGNCVHEMDPLTKTSTGNSICPAFPVSQRGLAFDPVSDTFFAGSWNDGAILRFDRTGEILETVSAGLDVSGLAYNPGTGHLFVLTNTDAAADLFVLDVNNGYANVGAFKIAGMGDYDQAGLDADCAGNLYAVNQGTGEVLVVPSGETGFCSYSTVPWLDETPKSGAIAAGATQAVTLDFTTALQWPGLHQANLRVAGTDPFPSSEVPVNFTISFLDVPDDYWSDSYIHALAGARITRGCGEGNYCPTATIDRAQMAVLIVRAMHGPLYAPPSATGIFSDVVISDTDTTADYIEQLYRDGVVAGCGTSPLRYCPTDLVNRAQMSVFVAKGLGLPVASPTGYFTDVSGTIYNGFAPYAEALFNANVTAGCGDHVFCPASEITRAELAVWLVKALGLPMAP